jgi:hypothetical protein
MNFDSDHVDGRGATVAGIGDGVSSDCESRAIGISFLGLIVYAHTSVRDILSSLEWYIVLSDEYNCVGACALAGDALGKAAEFCCVGLAPKIFVFGVDEEVAHFHECACFGIEDGIENLAREVALRCLLGRECLARDLIVGVETRQEGFLGEG